MFNLLAFMETEELVVMVSVLAILLIFAIAFIIGKKKTVISTKKLAVVALAISLTTTLSFLKFSLPFGGSITVFSLVPVILVAYAYGVYYGLLTGVVTGLIQFITSPYILTPLTFFLDYIFAFSAICFAGILKNVIKNRTASMALGCVIFYLVRFTMHVLSGIIYFNSGYITEGFPADNALIYSICYNAVYVLPDMLIALIFILPFSKNKSFIDNLQ
jgi:thiamine transporter